MVSVGAGPGCAVLLKGASATAPLAVRGQARCRRIASIQSCQPISTDVVSRIHSISAVKRKIDRNG